MHAGAQPGRGISGLLALFVHVLFFGLLLFGVSWQEEEIAPVFVEYWKELPPPPETPRTKVKPKPAKIKPKPAKVEPKPAKVEPKPAKVEPKLTKRDPLPAQRQLPAPAPVPTPAVAEPPAPLPSPPGVEAPTPSRAESALTD